MLSTIAGLTIPVSAGIGFQPVSPNELKMTGEPKAPGAPAIILFRQVDRDDRMPNAHEERRILASNHAS